MNCLLFAWQRDRLPATIREDFLGSATGSWALWAATECEAPALRVMRNPAAVETRDAALYESGVTALQPKLAVLDKALGEGGGFLVGRRFTVADLNVAEIIRYVQAGWS